MSLSGDQVRALVADLPQAQESAHHRHPDFRVGNKIFATLWPAKNRCNVRLSGAEAHALVNTEPQSYTLISDRGTFAWVAVDLTMANGPEVRELLEEAWRLRAPSELTDRVAD